MQKMFDRIKRIIDLVALSIANLFAWCVSDIERTLKIGLLIVSLGYALDRWHYWRKNRDKRPLTESEQI